MDFSQLPYLPKRKIFKMLSIGSRYNASLVWKDMAEETLRDILLSNSEFTTKLNNLYIDYLEIVNLECLETAGVLAEVGRLDSKKVICIHDINLASAPVNIVNSLLKVARNWLVFTRVNGFRLSMLQNIQCESLKLSDLKIASQVPQNINFGGQVILHGINGDLCGLFESITCGKLRIRDMTLNSDETRSLTEMLKSRLRMLEVTYLKDDAHENTLDYSVLGMK